MHTHAITPIIVRRIELAIPPDMDAVIMGGQPEISSVFLALSRMLPFWSPT